MQQVGITHYFSILKAKQELGYTPIVKPQDGMKATITYWKEKKRKEVDRPNIFVWLFCVGGMFQVFCCAFIPPLYLGPFVWVRSFALLMFQSIRNLRILFCLSALAHIAEACYAWFLAQRVDPSNVRGWFWQTFALGVFSLRLLLKRAKH